MNKKKVSIVSISLLVSLSALANNEQNGDREHETLLQQGWCEKFNDGHWSKHSGITQKEACEALDDRFSGRGRAYTWQHKKRIDSRDGDCIVNKTETSEGYRYDATQIGCENHDKNGFEDKYRWETDKPTVHTGEDQRGYSIALIENIPSLCQEGDDNRLCGLIKSYSVPEKFSLHFYEKPDYQGPEHIRSHIENRDNDYFIEGKMIRSIKISKNVPPIGNEKVTTSSQIYIGERKPTVIESCSVNGRLLSQEDIDHIGHANLCGDVTSPYAIWKIQGGNGHDQSFMGKNYNCEIKAGVNSWAPALCVMKSTTPDSNAFMYTAINFRGNKAWEGKAEVKKAGDNQPNATVNSFTLGAEVKVCTYLEINYTGILKEYFVSTAQVDLEIRSYKIKNTNDICD